MEPVGARRDDGSNEQALAVIEVARNSPAEKAGVMPGDLITHIDGEPVKDGRLTMHRIALLRPGDSVDIAIRRNEQTMELRTIVGVLNPPGG